MRKSLDTPDYPGLLFIRLPLTAAVAAAVLTTSPSVLAQKDSVANRNVIILEEVIVTAQRREQAEMTVPISMGTFDSNDVINTGALSLQDMNYYIPGVSVTEGQLTQSSVSIRGVSGSTLSSGGSPSVATFYDDSYLPAAATTVTFADLERIEVLKGPQGTLFGRNAAGGVVRIIPNRPGLENEGFVSTKLGNQGIRRVEGMGNIAATNSFYIRGNILYNESDGLSENTGSGGNPGAQHNIAARLSTLWAITDSTDWQVMFDWDKVDQAAPQGIGIGPYAYSTDPYASKVNNDPVDGGETRDMWSLGTRLEHTFNEAWSTKFILSYRDYETSNRKDEDGTSDITRYIDTDNIEDSDITYSEIQFNFNSNLVNLVFGGSFSKEKVKQDIAVHLSPDSVTRFVTNGINDVYGTSLDHIWNPDDWAIVTGALGFPSDQSDENYAAVAAAVAALTGEEPLIFGPSYAYANRGELYDEVTHVSGDFINWGLYADATFSLTNSLELSTGLRYSYDKKDFSWYTPLGEFATNHPELGINSLQILEQQDPALDASDNWSRTTGRVVLTWFVTEEVMTFANYSTGYKAGGYDAFSTSTATIPIEPELVTNYEIGMKGNFFSNRLRTQVGIYRVEVADQQRNELSRDNEDDTTPTYRAVNGDTKNTGIELTLDWMVLESLKLGLVTAYTHNEEKFDPYIAADGTYIEGESSAYGKPGENYTLTMDWAPQISYGSLLLHVDFVYSDRVNPGALDVYRDTPGYSNDRKRLNARLGWISENLHYEVAVWGQNMLNGEYTGAIGGVGIEDFDAPVASGVEDLITYGVDLRYNF